MSFSQGTTRVPKDKQVIASIMKELEITDCDQRVMDQLLDFNYRYSTTILDDAQFFSKYADKINIDVNDVKLAVELANNHLFVKPTPREILISAARDYNKTPLPPIQRNDLLRLPQSRSSNFLQTNYKLRTDLYSDKELKTVTKTTAKELLEKKMFCTKLNYEGRINSHANMLSDLDLQNVAEIQTHDQENVGNNYEIMDTD